MKNRKQKCDDESAAERQKRATEKLSAGKGKKNYRGADDEEDFDDEESVEKIKKLKVIA